MTKRYSQASDNDGRCEGCDQPASSQIAVPVLLAGLGPGGDAAWGTMWLCKACLDKEPYPRCTHGRGPGRCWCTKETSPMKTPIDRLKSKYSSVPEHLKAIEDALMEQFSIDPAQRAQVHQAVHAAFDVGHRTTTTDDWCDS